MSKKLPAWIVLTVISLVAALALGATYNGTKDRIAAQEAEKAVAVRQELLPAAARVKPRYSRASTPTATPWAMCRWALSRALAARWR